MLRRGLLTDAVVVCTVVASGCAAVAGCGSDVVADAGEPARELRVEVVAVHPHDPAAFTQGLEIHDGELLEGTGRVGASWVSATPIEVTPERVSISDTRRTRSDAAGDLFGEGITVVGDEVWQLTWKDGVALVRDRATLTERRRVEYSGEGWGLCAQPDRLVMSDGSADLIFRDRETFAETGRVTVRDDHPVSELNELECADDGRVYANVWRTDEIVRIDPDTGRVDARIDASELRRSLPDGAAVDVFNGIAEVPGTDRFLVTGKYWPTLFEVRFVS